MLGGLDAPAGPADSTFVATLIGVLGDEVPGLVIVLDDVHEVRDREVLDGIQHVTEWVDGRVRVALGCRFEPPIGLHRLRLTGRLHEVRAAQLAFTEDEANDFWDRHEVVLDADSRSALLHLTEGWPAGMRMAALSLEHGDDPAQFVAEFSGADRPVADYLAGEVLVRLPDDVVDFLLRTCIVEDLAVELAARLSGRDDSAAMLDDLAQRNALVVPLDRSGTWFRYHALLRTYLVMALQRRGPGEKAALQRVAAQWFLEQRQPGRALELAAAAADPELVESILLAHGLGLLLAGAGPTVRRSIALLPPSADRRPAVLVHRALLAVDEGDVAAADEALAALAATPDVDDTLRMTSLRKAAALHRARLAADLAVARASDLVEDIGPSHLPADLDPDVRLLVLADRGALRLFEGDHQRARRDLRQAIELAQAANLHSIQLYCTNLIAGTYVAENDFASARTAAEAAIALAATRGWDRTPTHGLLLHARRLDLVPDAPPRGGGHLGGHLDRRHRHHDRRRGGGRRAHRRGDHRLRRAAAAPGGARPAGAHDRLAHRPGRLARPHRAGGAARAADVPGPGRVAPRRAGRRAGREPAGRGRRRRRPAGPARLCAWATG